MDLNNKTKSEGVVLDKMKVTVFNSLKDVPSEEVLMPKQVHGDEIIFVRTGEEDLGDGDALVTENKSLALGIKTADCAAICFADGNKIGVAHVGWRGLCLGMIEKMLDHFDKDKVEIFVGPHLFSFEVKKDECYEKIFTVFGEKFFHAYDDKINFNFKAAIASRLPIGANFDPRNTETQLGLPSYRHRSDEDRLVTVVEFVGR